LKSEGRSKSSKKYSELNFWTSPSFLDMCLGQFS
jgi:hypothetical protein